jgi:prevent-host-death family protein
MSIVNVHEAKTQLSRILDRVAKGEEIVIAKAGRPVAKLVPLPSKPRKPGRCKGKIKIADDFDAPLPDSIMKGFLGESS